MICSTCIKNHLLNHQELGKKLENYNEMDTFDIKN